MGQNRQPDQRDVVCKITPTARSEAEALQSPRFAPELSCCWQDGRCRGRPARPVRRNALGPELRRCLQDCAEAVCGPGTAAAGGSARRPQDDFRGIASSNRDGWCAICDGCPGTPRDIPDRRRSSPGGSRCGVFADTQPHCRRPGVAGTSMAGKSVGSSDSAVYPYGRFRIRLRRFRNCCRVRTASPPVAQPQNRPECGRFSLATTGTAPPFQTDEPAL